MNPSKEEENNRRRSFIKQLTAVTALSGIVSCTGAANEPVNSLNIQTNKKYRWKMTTTWPPGFPVVGEGCQLLADWVKKMSNGRMEITVYGGGELIPALEGFDAVSNGAVEMNHGASYYWAGKIPAAPFFAAVPFGMNAQQMGAWIESGGGQKLWDALYAPHNLIPILAGNTGMQMGGWFNKEIRSLSDIKGLKMRIPGLGGKVFSLAGGTSVLVSGGEIYTNLERGVIDAAEWIGPYHDYLMGFHKIAPYYYYPGWQEPGPVLELIVNKPKFEALPSDLQEIIRTASARVSRWMASEFDARNGTYLKKLIEEKTQLRKFPEDVLNGLKNNTFQVLRELATNNKECESIYKAFSTFKNEINPWMEIGEKNFYFSM